MLEICHLTKIYGEKKAVDDFDMYPNTGHPVLGVQLYEIQLRVQADVRCVIPTREMAGNAGGHTRKELSRNNSQVGSNGGVVWAGSAAAQESE